MPGTAATRRRSRSKVLWDGLPWPMKNIDAAKYNLFRAFLQAGVDCCPPSGASFEMEPDTAFAMAATFERRGYTAKTAALAVRLSAEIASLSVELPPAESVIEAIDRLATEIEGGADSFVWIKGHGQISEWEALGAEKRKRIPSHLKSPAT